MKPLFNKVIILFLLILALNPNTVVEATSTSEIYRSARNSIVLIISYDKYGMPLGLGSGFFVSKREIATNHHVIEGATRIVFKIIGSDKPHKVISINKYSKNLDIAILSTDYEGIPLNLRVSEDYSVGDKVIAIGNPKGLEGSVSEGIISAKRKLDKFYVLQITAPISPGSSGGPLFDVNGQVIGIITATIQDAQNLNFAIPVSVLRKLKTHKDRWEPEIGKTAFQTRRGTAGLELVLPEIKGVYGTLSYSLKNTTKYAIEKPIYLLIFRSRSTGEIIHFMIQSTREVIPPGLAKRYRIRENAT